MQDTVNAWGDPADVSGNVPVRPSLMLPIREQSRTRHSVIFRARYSRRSLSISYLRPFMRTRAFS